MISAVMCGNKEAIADVTCIQYWFVLIVLHMIVENKNRYSYFLRYLKTLGVTSMPNYIYGCRFEWNFLGQTFDKHHNKKMYLIFLFNSGLSFCVRKYCTSVFKSSFIDFKSGREPLTKFDFRPSVNFPTRVCNEISSGSGNLDLWMSLLRSATVRKTKFLEIMRSIPR